MSDVDVEDYVIVPAAVSPSSPTTYAVSFLWLSREDPKAFIADKSWYNAIQSDLGDEWNLADLNACGVGIRIDKMISILWTWGKSTKSVNRYPEQRHLPTNHARGMVQGFRAEPCGLVESGPTNASWVKEVWVRFNDRK
jgi:hypothetical protein